MRGAKAIRCTVVSVLIIAYLIFTPHLILRGIENGRKSYFEKPEEKFRGIINVWHIAGFKAYSGAVGNLLRERTSRISDKHFGVYFRVISMTATEYAERIARGEQADVYSYPLGSEYSDRLLSLDAEKLPVLRDGILQTGEDDGILYAVPYMYSGYCLAVNCSLLKEQPTTESVSSENLTEKCKRLTTDKHTALCGNELCAALYGFTGRVGQIDTFRSGYAEYAFTDFRTVGDIDRKNAQGKGFPIAYYPVSAYTDLVQYLCINKNIDERKLDYIYMLISDMLTETVQNKIADMGAYTVTEPSDLSELTKRYTSAPADMLTLYLEPEIPNTFAYRRCRDSLTDEARLALEGDREKLAERINELIRRSE